MFRLSEYRSVGAAQTNGCVIGVETQTVERKKQNTRLIRRLMMDSAAKTLSPTADSSMIHHAPPFISVPSYYFWLPRVLFGLFNFAHPIIRNLKRTSSRLFLLPGTAVCRTDRGGAHIGSVVATCSGSLSEGGGAPLLWLLYRNLWHSGEQAKSEAPGADPRTLEVPEGGSTKSRRGEIIVWCHPLFKWTTRKTNDE